MVRTVAIAAVSALLFIPAQGTVGTVLDVQGQWILEGQPPVTIERGSPLPSGGLIRPPRAPRPGDRLQAVFVFDGDHTRALRVNCDPPSGCAKPVQLPTLPTSSRLAAQLKRIREAHFLLTSDNSLFARRMARDDDSLRDAVVRGAEGMVDLAPAIAQLPNQRYVARFSAIAATRETSTPLESSVFSPRDSSAVRVSGVQPGLYRVELVVAGEYTRAGPEVWLLVTDARRYPDTAAAFSQASTAAESWKDEADLATRQAFLRAFLQTLAGETRPGR